MMGFVLVDSNVLLDVMTEDPKWSAWSADQLGRLAETHSLVVNPIIYAEVSIRFQRIEELDRTLSEAEIQRHALPWEAAFLAGKCFLRYRKLGGARRSPLPDFFIGAHAAVEQIPLLTRDVGRYKSYFPKLDLIAPG